MKKVFKIQCTCKDDSYHWKDVMNVENKDEETWRKQWDNNQFKVCLLCMHLPLLLLKVLSSSKEHAHTHACTLMHTHTHAWTHTRTQFDSYICQKNLLCLLWKTKLGLKKSLNYYINYELDTKVMRSNGNANGLVIISGMNYLHREAPVKVIHRDLKSKNGMYFQWMWNLPDHWTDSSKIGSV